MSKKATIAKKASPKKRKPRKPEVSDHDRSLVIDELHISIFQVLHNFKSRIRPGVELNDKMIDQCLTKIVAGRNQYYQQG